MNMSNYKVDIIIPIYNARDTLSRALSSIAQQTIVDDILVTLVNDCDGQYYYDIVKTFSKILNIQYLVLDKNSGPGVARQFGIDNSKSDYIMFCDADDALMGPFAVQVMYNEMENKLDVPMMMGRFDAIDSSNKKEIKFTSYGRNFVWVFAKIYRRSFLEKYNIRFNTFRINEDVAFNRSIQMIAIEDNQIPLEFNCTIYCWFDTPHSITRKDPNFIFTDNFIAYIDNMMYAIDFARKSDIKNSHQVNHKVIETMGSIYCYFIESIHTYPKCKIDNLIKSKEFYDKHYKYLDLTFNSSVLDVYIVKAIQKTSNRIDYFLPELTFHQFINLLKEEDNYVV